MEIRHAPWQPTPGGSHAAQSFLKMIPEKGWAYPAMLPCLEQITLWKINKDPENHKFLEETNLPTPIYQGLC